MLQKNNSFWLLLIVFSICVKSLLKRNNLSFEKIFFQLSYRIISNSKNIVILLNYFSKED